MDNRNNYCVVSNPQLIPVKKMTSYCNSVSSLENKYCNQYTIKEFLESPKEFEESPIQLFQQYKLGIENNPPPNSFSPPNKNKLLQNILLYLKQYDQHSYSSVSTYDIDKIENDLLASPYKDMMFILDN